MPTYLLVHGAWHSDRCWGVTDPADVAWLRSMLSDMPVLCLEQKVHLDDPAARAIPRTYIHNTVQPPGLVRRPVPATQPDGEPSVVRELPTGHDCMITMPDELSALLLDAACRSRPVGTR